MKLIQPACFSLLNTKHQTLAARQLNDFIYQALKLLIFMAKPESIANIRICQLQFIMVGSFLCKEQTSQQFKNKPHKINVLRRKGNSFWQRGAGLASLAQQKGLFLYDSTNTQLTGVAWVSNFWP